MISEVYNVDCLEYMRSFPHQRRTIKIIMKPYGREKHVSGGNNWKIDFHIRPKRKFQNWWEDICQLIPRSTMKAKEKKEIEEELLKSLLYD